MGIPWDGIDIICCGMGWDGTEKYVPWTSLGIRDTYIKTTLKKNNNKKLENYGKGLEYLQTLKNGELN